MVIDLSSGPVGEQVAAGADDGLDEVDLFVGDHLALDDHRNTGRIRGQSLRCANQREHKEQADQCVQPDG